MFKPNPNLKKCYGKLFLFFSNEVQKKEGAM